jgi:uncharacterized protein involved in cysteine biosynthesis
VSADEPPNPTPRPGLVLRAAAGAWHVPAGLGLLLQNRSLWSLSILPTAVAAVLLNLGLVAGAFLAPQIETRLAPSQAHLPAVLGLALTLSLWFGVVVATTALGLALALLVTAPLLERLSRKVEAQLGGRGAVRVPSERWSFIFSMRSGLVFVGAATLALGLAIVPLVGPILSAALSAPLLAYQAIDPALTRRDFRFGQKKSWHLRWRGEVVGFGLAALVALLVPLVNAFLPPALAVGATRLVLDLDTLDADGGQAKGPAPEDTPTSPTMSPTEVDGV